MFELFRNFVARLPALGRIIVKRTEGNIEKLIRQLADGNYKIELLFATALAGSRLGGKN